MATSVEINLMKTTLLAHNNDLLETGMVYWALGLFHATEFSSKKALYLFFRLYSGMGYLEGELMVVTWLMSKQ
jgi:hypothetical protein